MVDVAVRKAPDSMKEVGPEEDPDVQDEIELELMETSDSSEMVKQIVTASVLAALSIAIAPSALAIQRVAGWGIALFDPVSLLRSNHFSSY